VIMIQEGLCLYYRREGGFMLLNVRYGKTKTNLLFTSFLFRMLIPCLVVTSNLIVIVKEVIQSTILKVH